MFHRQREMALADAYDFASKVMAENMSSSDAGEGIDAFLAKRNPVWGTARPLAGMPNH